MIQQLGLKLRELRIKEGLSIEEFALKAEIKRQNVNQIETGTRAVSLQRMKELFNLLGYEVEFNYRIKKVK